MSWTLTTSSAVVFLGGVTSCVVGMAVLRERPDPMAWPLATLLFVAVAWAVPHAISFGFDEYGKVLFWNRIVDSVAVLVPVAYFVVALTYAGYDRWLTRRTYAVLMVVPLGTVLVVWTNNAHTLFMRSVETEKIADATVLVPEYGPWYWVSLSYAYLLIGASFLVFASVAISTERIHRKQSLLMLIGGIVPTAANVSVNAGIGPMPEIDFTSTMLTVTGVTFAVALFRYDLLDLSPTAYRNVPDTFGDGVLVFDGEKRLVEANDHARRILDTELEPGRVTDDILDPPVEEVDGTVVTTVEEFRRFYNLRYSPLEDHHDEVVGHAVVMREVTELKDHEQRLSVTNRILRHNLRNELTIILGEADYLARRDPEPADSVERILKAGERLQDVSQKARHIQASMRFDDDALVVDDLVPVVESAVVTYRREFPDAVLRLDAPDRAFVLASDRKALETVVRNVIENALEHNDTDNPEVEVTVEETDGRVQLSVADDGPGIPSAEQEILRHGHETQLEHGSSIGLWLVYWLVSAMGGDVSFEDREPRGTVVTLTFRGSEEPPSESAADPARRLAPKSVETD